MLGLKGLCWSFIGIMEKKMETTRYNIGFYWDNGKENGNYRLYDIGVIGFILEFYWDNGKENGNYR